MDQEVATYNKVGSVAAGWINNAMVGDWTSYGKANSKPANWGDGRIPFSEDLDVGTSEFAPNSKYFDKGWKSYFDGGDVKWK